MGRIVELSITDICKRYKVELVDNNISLQNCPKCGGKTERKEIDNVGIGIKDALTVIKRHLGIHQCSKCATKFTTRGLAVASLLYPELLYVLKHNGIELRLEFKFTEQKNGQ